MDFATIAAWREDLRYLQTQLPSHHKNFFYHLSRTSFDSAVSALDSSVLRMTRSEAEVAFERLIALAGDAHTNLNPMFEGRLGYHYLPIKLALFADGLFVQAADSANEALVGSRVTRIGQLSVDSAIRLVSAVIPHENDFWVLAQAPFLLGIPEILQALGISESVECVPLTLVTSTGKRTVTLTPAGELRPPSGEQVGKTIDMSRWVEMRQSAPVPLYLDHPDRPYWVQYLPASRTLYVSYRASVSRPDESNAAFMARVFAMVDTLQVDKFVIDLRSNSGGESYYNKSIVLGIVRHVALDRPGKIFAIIGRNTFSAAMNLVLELERYTSVTFVGEPTGNAVQFFADHDMITLPNSGLHIAVATHWYQAPFNPKDTRPYVAPHFAIDVSSSDYRRGDDPILAFILSRGSIPTFTEQLRTAVLSGRLAAADQLIRDFSAAPVNRYSSAETEINALGYRLLGENRTPDAIAAFQLNAKAFTRSANAHDSLAEAYERAGQRDASILKYRRALTLDPTLSSALAGLARLHAQR